MINLHCLFLFKQIYKKYFNTLVGSKISNGLIYSLICKQQLCDRDYIQRDPRHVVISDTYKC